MLKLISFLSILVYTSSYTDADKLNREQLYCLSKAVYHESRGEDAIGQAAVAHVVINRVKSGKYPDTICEVVYQPYQFTDLYRSTKVSYDDVEWDWSVSAAVLAYIGFTGDPTDGALFYHNPKKADPYHYKYAFNQIEIGNHLFYNLERK